MRRPPICTKYTQAILPNIMSTTWQTGGAPAAPQANAYPTAYPSPDLATPKWQFAPQQLFAQFSPQQLAAGAYRQLIAQKGNLWVWGTLFLFTFGSYMYTLWNEHPTEKVAFDPHVGNQFQAIMPHLSQLGNALTTSGMVGSVILGLESEIHGIVGAAFENIRRKQTGDIYETQGDLPGGHASIYGWFTKAKVVASSTNKHALAQAFLMRSFSSFGAIMDSTDLKETQDGLHATFASGDQVFLPFSGMKPVTYANGLQGFQIVAITKGEHALCGALVHTAAIGTGGEIYTVRLGLGKSPLSLNGLPSPIDIINNFIGPRFWETADHVNASSLDARITLQLENQLSTAERGLMAARHQMAQTPWRGMAGLLAGGSYFRAVAQENALLRMGAGTRFVHGQYFAWLQTENHRLRTWVAANKQPSTSSQQ